MLQRTCTAMRAGLHALLRRNKAFQGACRELHRVAVVGSGNWGSVACRIAASNALRQPDVFEQEVKMWVFEEQVEGGKLTDVINETNENVKYLPGVKLGENVRAMPDLREVVQGSTTLIMVSPHQFLKKVCNDVADVVDKNATAISLIKGMDITPDGPQLLSTMVREHLGIDCSVLMGANIAKDVAKEEFSEATIGYRNKASGELYQKLFNTSYFHCTPVEDVEGTEMCGTLKNIIALGAGFCDGLGLGTNSKAAIIRVGLLEMKKFSQALFPSVKDDTFFESCGVADLVVTCLSGRNRKVAEAFVASGGQKSWDVLESELLNGQKLQGVLTSHEVQQVLVARQWEKRFPLFTTIHKIASQELPPSAIIDYQSASV